MPVITVDLQDGFQGDTVFLHLGGREVLRADGVNTRFQTGFARSITIQGEAGAARLQVSVPDRGLRQELDLDLRRPVFLGISLTTEGTLRCRVSQEPFGYV